MEKKWIVVTSIVFKNGVKFFSDYDKSRDVCIAKHESQESLAMIKVPQDSENFFKLLELYSSFATTADDSYVIIVDIDDILQVVR